MSCSHRLQVNPSFPVNTTEEAYTTLPEIRELVRATLVHLGEDPRVLDTFGGRGIEIKFTKATKQHGAFRVNADMPEVRAAALKVYGRPAQSRKEVTAPAMYRQLFTDGGFKLALTFARDSFTHTDAAHRADTVIHETCHLVDFLRAGGVVNDAHGAAWARLMQECGAAPQKKSAAGAEAYAPHVRCACMEGAWRPANMSDAVRIERTRALCARCKQPFEVREPEAKDARSQFNRAVTAGRRKEEAAVQVAAYLQKTMKTVETLRREGKLSMALFLVEQALNRLPDKPVNRHARNTLWMERVSLKQAMSQDPRGKEPSDEEMLAELGVRVNPEPADDANWLWLLDAPGPRAAAFMGAERGATKRNGVSHYHGEFGAHRFVLRQDGTPVAGLQVVNNTVAHVFTGAAFRRKGYAEKLFQHAQQVLGPLKYSEHRTPEGEQFAKAVRVNPSSLVTPGTEHLWERAKQRAEEQGHAGNWAYVTSIYARMRGAS